LLKDHNFGLANVIMLVFSIGMFGSTFLMPMYLQNSLGYTAVQAGAVFLPVGIIQGIAAPFAGRMADKFNPKIPIMLGIVLLGISFLLNTRLSFLTEHSFIMLSLYIRGFAMGILFTPLSTISLLQIPREKMAQASGVANTIRQLGGSLGIAILATLLSTRVDYHTQMYGQAIQVTSPAYKTTVTQLQYSIQHQAGSSPSTAIKQSQALIASNLGKQAFIQGIDDDFMFAAFASLIGGIPIIFLRVRKKQIKQ
jgi:DHA2 family multidrug resistance protein